MMFLIDFNSRFTSIGNIMIQIMLALSLLFFYELQAQNDVLNHCFYTFEYDNAGNPKKMRMQMYQTSVPIIDGMRMKFAKEELLYEQEFAIDSRSQISQSSTSSSFRKITHDVELLKNSQIKSAISQFQNSKSGFYCSAKLVAHQGSVFEAMSGQEILQLLFYDRYCRFFYHMNNLDKINMMRLHREKFINKLLLDETLQDRAVWELWQEYKPTVWGDTYESEQRITEQLNIRQSKREKEVQKQFCKIIDQQKKLAQQELEQKRLEQIYKSDLLVHSDSPHKQERELAFKQTKASGYQKENKT